MIGFTGAGMTPFSVVQRGEDGRPVVIRNGQASSAETIAAQKAHPGEIVICGEAYEVGTILTADGVITPQKPVVPLTVEQIKAEAARRLRSTDWMVTRATDPSDGRPMPEAVVEQRRRIKQASESLEGLSKIPPDYRDDKYWT